MRFIDKLFPVICVGCGQKGSYICPKCKKQLKAHPEICPVCHKPSQNFQVCAKCKDPHKIHYEGIIICMQYNDIIKNLLLGLKYQHRYHTGEFLAQRLLFGIISNPIIADMVNKDDVIITSVSSHWIRKYFVKGYNQSEVMAMALTKEMKGLYLNLCKKINYTKSQTKLNRQKRLTNLLGVYRLRKNLDLKGKDNIIIIDDITTTGSTINEIAKTIKKTYPNVKIRGAVVGRSVN